MREASGNTPGLNSDDGALTRGTSEMKYAIFMRRSEHTEKFNHEKVIYLLRIPVSTAGILYLRGERLSGTVLRRVPLNSSVVNPVKGPSTRIRYIPLSSSRKRKLIEHSTGWAEMVDSLRMYCWQPPNQLCKTGQPLACGAIGNHINATEEPSKPTAAAKRYEQSSRSSITASSSRTPSS